MKQRRQWIITVLLAIFTMGGVALAQPPAPSSLFPANGASVTVPFTISWSAVSDPSGIVGYNWEVSPSSKFLPVIQQNSTSGETQDIVSGLANGTYFWHVEAVNGDFVTGAWSNTQSFTVTGANSGELGSPTLDPPQGGTAFHPMEVIYFNWSAVAGADTYSFDVSWDPSFPLNKQVHFDNIPSTETSYSIELGDSWPQGTQYARVAAVNADGIAGVPSNRVKFTLSFKAKLPPPPTLLSPAEGAIVVLPVTLMWTDVPNPQPSGYGLEIATDKKFRNIEYINDQITGPEWTINSITAGTKYWHVLSTQGDSAPGVAANTGWSATGSFIVPSTPTLGAVTVAGDPVSNGDIQTVSIQLTAPAPAGGAIISLVSSDPIAAPAPATFTMAAGFAFGQFQFPIGAVTASTPVTLTATYASSSASASFTVLPPTLQSLAIAPITGGVATDLIVMLRGDAPAGGAVVSLFSSDSSLASVPATATVAPGDESVVVGITTGAVTTNTTLTITASWNGTTVHAPLTLTPQQAPASLALDPNPTTQFSGSFATVTVASAPPSDLTLPVTCGSPLGCPFSVVIPAGSTTGGFNISTTSVTTHSFLDVSVTGAGVTITVPLEITP